MNTTIKNSVHTNFDTINYRIFISCSRMIRKEVHILIVLRCILNITFDVFTSNHNTTIIAIEFMPLSIYDNTCRFTRSNRVRSIGMFDRKVDGQYI